MATAVIHFLFFQPAYSVCHVFVGLHLACQTFSIFRWWIEFCSMRFLHHEILFSSLTLLYTPFLLLLSWCMFSKKNAQSALTEQLDYAEMKLLIRQLLKTVGYSSSYSGGFTLKANKLDDFFKNGNHVSFFHFSVVNCVALVFTCKYNKLKLVIQPSCLLIKSCWNKKLVDTVTVVFKHR